MFISINITWDAAHGNVTFCKKRTRDTTQLTCSKHTENRDFLSWHLTCNRSLTGLLMVQMLRCEIILFPLKSKVTPQHVSPQWISFSLLLIFPLGFISSHPTTIFFSVTGDYFAFLCRMFFASVPVFSSSDSFDSFSHTTSLFYPAFCRHNVNLLCKIQEIRHRTVTQKADHFAASSFCRIYREQSTSDGGQWRLRDTRTAAGPPAGCSFWLTQLMSTVRLKSP